jgi:Mg-chelatase subunit ChlD
VRQIFGKDSVLVEFTADQVKMDRDFVLTVARKEGFENRGYAVARGDDLFLQMDLCPREEEEKPASNQEIIFLLDCSGSMGGSSIKEPKKP